MVSESSEDGQDLEIAKSEAESDQEKYAEEEDESESENLLDGAQQVTKEKEEVKKKD